MYGNFANYTIEVRFEGFTSKSSEKTCLKPTDFFKTIDYKSNASYLGDVVRYEYIDAIPFAKYSIRVRAANRNFIGNYSTSANCIINPVLKAPSPPQAIQFGNTSVTFTTTVQIPKNFCGETNAFFVCGNQKSSHNSLLQIDDKFFGIFKSTIEGLVPFTSYECHAVFEYDKQKAESSKVSFKTLEGSM